MRAPKSVRFFRRWNPMWGNASLARHTDHQRLVSKWDLYF